MNSDSRGERIHLSSPDVTEVERAHLLEAFDSGWIAPLGPAVDDFESRLARRCEVGHAVALSSGTAALHLALIALGVGPGAEVLIPTTTFAATANAVAYCGASPVLIDVQPRTWQVDADLLVDELDRLARSGHLPAAVVPVDLYGGMPDYQRILDSCEKYEVPLVEDAAEAIGSTLLGRPAGTLGTAGVLSFNGNKLMTTSGGGALLTDDSQLAERVRHLSTQAKAPRPFYWHEEVGYNYRLSNLLAGLGIAQLSRLDEMVAARRSHFDAYRAAFPDRSFVDDTPGVRSNRWLSVIRLDQPGDPSPLEVMKHLEGFNIESRLTWTPLHSQPAFGGFRQVGGGVAESLFDVGLCLPSGSAMSSLSRERVIEQLSVCIAS